jgi:hypothetical protein
MRRLLTAFAILCLSTAAYAQEPAAPAAAAKKITIGADVAFVLPLGDWGDATSIGIGILARAEYAINPKLALVGMPGYIFHLSKSVDAGAGSVDMSTTEIPIFLGARYLVTPQIFATAMTGLNFCWATMGDSSSDTQTRIPLYIGGGYKMGKIEFGAAFILPNLLLQDDGEKTQMGILAHVGYDITAM